MRPEAKELRPFEGERERGSYNIKPEAKEQRLFEGERERGSYNIKQVTITDNN